MALDRPPSWARSALPSSLVRYWITARRSLRSSSGRPAGRRSGRPGSSEDSWVSLRSSTLDSRVGPEAGHGRAHRHAGADAAEREELDREGGRRPVVSPVSVARWVILSLLAAGCGEAGQVALDVGDDDRDAGGGQLLGQHLQRLGLAGAGGARDQAVPVHHRQRHPDLRVRDRPARRAPPRRVRALHPSSRTRRRCARRICGFGSRGGGARRHCMSAIMPMVLIASSPALVAQSQLPRPLRPGAGLSATLRAWVAAEP